MSPEVGENFFDEDGENKLGDEPEFRVEQPREKIELSNKEFLDVLCSERFLGVINKAGRTTKRSGHETGFGVFVLEDKSFLIPGIKEGSNTSMGRNGEEKIIEGKSIAEEVAYKKCSEIGFHFHPGEGEAVMPSSSDLNALCGSESLFGVCQIEKDSAINILLVRAKNYIHPSEISENANSYAEELDESGIGDLSPKRGQGVVFKALDNNGFEAFLISFLYKKGKYELTDESKETISKMGDLKLDLSK